MSALWFKNMQEFDVTLASRVNVSEVAPAWGVAWVDLSLASRALLLTTAGDILLSDPAFQFPPVAFDETTNDWAPGHSPDTAMQVALALWTYRTWFEPDMFARVEDIARGLRSRSLPHVTESYAPIEASALALGLYGAQVTALLAPYRIEEPEAVGGCV